LKIFKKSLEKIQVSLQSDRLTPTLPLYSLIISCLVLLGTRNVSDTSCRENQNTFFMFKNFFENLAVYKITWKLLYSRTGYTWQNGECTFQAGQL